MIFTATVSLSVYACSTPIQPSESFQPLSQVKSVPAQLCRPGMIRHCTVRNPTLVSGLETCTCVAEDELTRSYGRLPQVRRPSRQ